jgi:hypothetical protein
VNDLIMLFLFAPIVRFLVSGASSLHVPFQMLLYAVAIFIVIPLTVGSALQADLAIARTGLLDREAALAGFSPLNADDGRLRPHGVLSRAERLRIGRSVHRSSARHGNRWSLEGRVAKRIDVFATALFHGMKVGDINALDLSWAAHRGYGADCTPELERNPAIQQIGA